MSALNLTQQVTADSSGAFSVTFGQPGSGYVWTGQITATSSQALSNVSFQGTRGGQDVGTWYGPLPFGPIQARNGETITIQGANASPGQVINVNYLGSVDTGLVPAYGPAPQGALPPALPNQVILGSNFAYPNQTAQIQITLPANIPDDITGFEVVALPSQYMGGAILQLDGYTVAEASGSPVILPNIGSAIAAKEGYTTNVQVDVVPNTGYVSAWVVGVRGSLSSQISSAPANQIVLASGSLPTTASSLDLPLNYVPAELTGIIVITDPPSALATGSGNGGGETIGGVVQAPIISSPAVLPNFSPANDGSVNLTLVSASGGAFPSGSTFTIMGLRGAAVGVNPVKPNSIEVSSATLTTVGTFQGLVFGPVLVYWIRTGPASAANGAAAVMWNLFGDIYCGINVDSLGHMLPDETVFPMPFLSPSELIGATLESGTEAFVAIGFAAAP